MNRQQEEILRLIKQDEGLNLEFKESRQELNKDVFETVCAFLNRHGGTLVLGVDNSGIIKGIDPASVQKIKKDFVTTINNLS